MRRQTKTATILVIVLGLLAFWLSQRDWLVHSRFWEKAEGALIDQRYHWRGEQPADPDIVLVGVEDSSLTLDNLWPEEIKASPTLQLMTQPYPWNRRVHAAVLDKLMGAGAKVVMFDFVFSGANDGDEEFARVIKKYPGRVVLASRFESGDHELRTTPPTAQLLDAVTKDGVGLAAVWTDSDGTLRRGQYRTSLERENRGMNKFAGTAYPDDLTIVSALAVQKFTGSVETPPDDHDNFIDFQGGKNTYKPLPVEALFVDKLWSNPPINGDTAFRGKIVIVGPIGNIFHDIHKTPFGETPGPEVQAQMMATLLHHSTLREPSPSVNGLLAFCMMAIALAICLVIRNALVKTLLLAGTTVGFIFACHIAFSRHGMVIMMMQPLFSFLASGSLGIVLQYVLEQRERRRYRSVLDRYVSKNVAKLILSDTRSFEDSLNGRKQSITVLFCDIRGFTGMSEGRDPAQLVSQLNEYFLQMVGVVQAHDGTVQKFIGDAIMAAWGDAYSAGVEEDARRAVSTALHMRTALIKLNEQWQGQANRVPLRIGIGINNGEMIVGNVGHPDVKMEFTVLGDGVNLAARLESATKQFRTDLLVGESVEALTRANFIFRRVGLLTVQGKTKAVEAFDVLGERPQPDPAWLARYHEAVALFRQRQFEAAGKLFKAVTTEIGQPDFLCQMYGELCAAYQQSPPPADWNGAIVLSEK